MLTAKDLSLKDIEYALTLSKTQHFGQAAELCHISQPALSKQIKQLETQLGIKLFERTSRKVLLTDAGKLFIEHALKLMDNAENLLANVKKNTSPLSGLFRLGVIASSCAYLMPHLIPKFNQKFPQLKLAVKEGYTHTLIEDLKRGELDFFIAATTFDAPEFEKIDLFFEPFILAYNPKIIKGLPKHITPSDVDIEQLLLLEDGHCLKDQTLQVCSVKEDYFNQSFKASGIETLIQMTASGLGSAILPSLVTPELKRFKQQLSYSSFKNKHTGRTMALFYRNSSPYKKDFELFSQTLKMHLPNLVKPL